MVEVNPFFLTPKTDGLLWNYLEPRELFKLAAAQSAERSLRTDEPVLDLLFSALFQFCQELT
jgi:hypothetical protein